MPQPPALRRQASSLSFPRPRLTPHVFGNDIGLPRSTTQPSITLRLITCPHIRTPSSVSPYTISSLLFFPEASEDLVERSTFLRSSVYRLHAFLCSRFALTSAAPASARSYALVFITIAAAVQGIAKSVSRPWPSSPLQLASQEQLILIGLSFCPPEVAPIAPPQLQPQSPVSRCSTALREMPSVRSCGQRLPTRAASTSLRLVFQPRLATAYRDRLHCRAG